MTGGKMEYVLPDRTVTYRGGDFFFETGDVSHQVESRTASRHLLFEIVPVDARGASVVPPVQQRPK
jgi:hypothetical protein